MYPVKKYVPPFKALEDLKRYCSVQERSMKAVREKLVSWGLKGDQVDNIIAELISTNYLNEQRFAEAYVSGKFKIKSWGRRKIVQGMKQLEISEACISIALNQIEEDEYEECLERWVEKRARHEKGRPVFETRGRIARYLINKGYESELVWNKVNKLVGHS